MLSCIGYSLRRSLGTFFGFIICALAFVPVSDPDSAPWKTVAIAGRFSMTVPESWVVTIYDLPGVGQEMTIIRDPDNNALEVQVISVLNEEGRECTESLLVEVSQSFIEGAGYTSFEGIPKNYNHEVHSLISACCDKDGKLVMMITREAGPYLVFIIGTYTNPAAISSGVNELGVMAGSLSYTI